jgi:hypothetical protein
MSVDQDGNDHKDAWNGTPGALKSGDHTDTSGQIRTVVDFHGTALTVSSASLCVVRNERPRPGPTCHTSRRLSSPSASWAQP